MKGSKAFILICALIIFFVFTINVYAADALYRFMHNDHEALVLGEIVHIDEKFVSMRIEKTIVSAKDLNQSSPKKQVKLKNVDIVTPMKYMTFTIEGNTAESEPTIGDYALTSLQKT